MYPNSLLENLNQPGSHRFFFEGGEGQLEAVLTIPDKANLSLMALIGHPHPLFGGTMDNKVVTTLTRAFTEMGIPSIRFNFRGVGQSFGTYDEGIGESEDMIILADLCTQALPDCRFIWAGFSFGTFVTYRAALKRPGALLLSVAPPVHHFDYEPRLNLPFPWVLMQGTEDEVVPFEVVNEFSNQHKPPLDLVVFKDTTHFFHGKLVLLKEAVIQLMRRKGLVS